LPPQSACPAGTAVTSSIMAVGMKVGVGAADADADAEVA
jgi:hypothetical protein